jgi:Kef-type K+ transport system membrane component KefB
MFLLFCVGLDVRSSELMRVGGSALLVAVLGVIAPFFLGAAIMLAFGAPWIESIFVGAAMVATSVGITAQVLAAKGVLQHPASRVILGAAVIDDVLGLIVLAVVSSLAEGHLNPVKLATTAIAAIGFTWIVARCGTRAMRRLAPHIEARFQAGDVQFNLAMVLLFGLALLAGYIGSQPSSARFSPAWPWRKPSATASTTGSTASPGSCFRSSSPASACTWI